MIGETPRNKLGETPNEAFEKSPYNNTIGDAGTAAKPPEPTGEEVDTSLLRESAHELRMRMIWAANRMDALIEDGVYDADGRSWSERVRGITREMLGPVTDDR